MRCGVILFFGDFLRLCDFRRWHGPLLGSFHVCWNILNQAASQLPDGVQPRLGPDASGVGWVYEYALTDRSGAHDLAQLRSLQDWFLKFELQTVPGVSEVATVGGMVRQYQIVVDPNRFALLRHSVTPGE